MPTIPACRCCTRCATNSACTGFTSAAGWGSAARARCTIYGEALRCCVMPVSAVAGAEVVTLEGLGTPEKPHPLQQAFIDEQAVQCGYCINGMIMQAAAFLATTERPTEDQVRQALAGQPVQVRHPCPHRARGHARSREDGLSEDLPCSNRNRPAARS